MDTSYGGMFKPITNKFQWLDMKENQYLFLEIVNYKDGGYLNARHVDCILNLSIVFLFCPSSLIFKEKDKNFLHQLFNYQGQITS